MFIISLIFSCIIYRKDSEGNTKYNRIVTLISGSIISAVLIFFLFHFFIISLVDMKFKMKSKKEHFRDHKNMTFLVLYSLIVTIFTQLMLLILNVIVSMGVFWYLFIILIVLISFGFAHVFYGKDLKGSKIRNQIIFSLSGIFTAFLSLMVYGFEVEFIILVLFCFLINFIIMSILNVILYKKKEKNYLRDYKSIALTALYSIIVTAILVLLFLFLMTGV